MSKSTQFPNDRRITVVRPDGTEYKTWASEHLIKVHKWTASEVRVQQSFNAAEA